MRDARERVTGAARPVWRLVAVLVPLLAAYNNVLLPAAPGYPQTYVVTNLAAAGVTLAAGVSAGLTARDLGLAPARLRAGLRLGSAAALAVGAGYAAALALPATRPLLADDRLRGVGVAEVLADVLVTIPLGTVLWEEVAFRGVLLGALLKVVATARAVAASAALFGVWHIRPTAEALADNGIDGGLALLGVLGGVVATAVAGLIFAWLRLRSGSLLAPVLLHLATNCLGALAAVSAHALLGPG